MDAAHRSHRTFRTIAFAAALSGSVLGVHAADKKAESESRYYQMVTLPVPAGITLEGGALQFLPGGKLASATRFGDIYIIDDPLKHPPTHVNFALFASGLHEVLGLAYRDGWLYCTQRGEMTRMK